jgi:hypothetical protein
LILLQQPAPAMPQLKPLPTSNDAQALALADLCHVPLPDRPYTRYIWAQNGDKLGFKTLSLAINMISRASVIVRPEPVANGILVLRVRSNQWRD